MSKHVLVVGESNSYYRPFRKFGKYTHDQGMFTKSPDDIALVVFTGGADISPSMYRQKASRQTGCYARRDVYEMIAFRRAERLKLPIVGICRGAQFLCVMAGGKLVQHVTDHGGYHGMRTWDNRLIEVNSTHHQMMLPPKTAQVLGWAEPRRSKIYIGGSDKEIEAPEQENEVVYFPNIRALGMQYHPEGMPDHSEGYQLAIELTEVLIGDGKYHPLVETPDVSTTTV